MPKRPHVLCAGDCGGLLWDSKTSLPAGERMCQRCRRDGRRTQCKQGHALAGDNVYVAPRTGYRSCRICSGEVGSRESRSVICRCGQRFSTTHPTRKWCSGPCREAWSRRKPKSRSDPRTGRPYRRLRLQVLAEESVCWICRVPFFGTWPMPLSPTMDHVIAISKGGAVLDRNNVRAAHFRCNTSRNNRSVAGRPEVFAP